MDFAVLVRQGKVRSWPHICYTFALLGVGADNCTMKNTNVLTHIADFRDVLEGYTPSSESIEILKNTPLVLLVGPTAAGRNTLINLLVQTGRYHYIISDTTRKPRANNGIMERDGVEYWFRS